MSTTCPFCDSDDVEKIEITETFPIPLCQDAPIRHSIMRCNSCEEEGDFDGTLDKELTKAIDAAHTASAPQLMEELKEMGISMTYFEKALRLPFRTTARWKQGKISHAALALLRIIRFSPAMLHAADNSFSSQAAVCYQLSQPWVFFTNNTIDPEYSLEVEPDRIKMNYTGTYNNCRPFTTSTIERPVEWMAER